MNAHDRKPCAAAGCKRPRLTGMKYCSIHRADVMKTLRASAYLTSLPADARHRPSEARERTQETKFGPRDL